MTGDADARQGHEHRLFLADIYPELGEHLAAQCAAGYDTGAGRARFLAWLTAHAEEAAIAEAGEILVLASNDEDLPAAQVQVAGATAPVTDYLMQIGKVPPLNAEQETELAKRIEACRSRRGEAGRGRGDGRRPAHRPGVDRRGRPPG